MGVHLDALAAWMDRNSLGEGPLEDVTQLRGGTQNIILRFRRGDRGYVLRRPPLNLRPKSNETMRREARLLSALANTSIPHPRIIAACPDEKVLGAAFYLMQPIDGFNVMNGLPTLHSSSAEVRNRMGLAMVEAIAALGSLDFQELGLEGFGKPDNFLERQVERWKSQLESYAEFPNWPGAQKLPAVDRITTWLNANRPGKTRPGIIHGDYQLSNVLFCSDSPELAAIVDWELATIGDPLIDLGWLLATWQEDDEPSEFGFRVSPWTGFPSPDELVAHYQKHSDRDLSAIDWYAVLACYKLGIILEGTFARASAGLAPRETGDFLHGETIRLFERTQRWIN